MRENHFVVHMHGLPGTSLDKSMAGGERVTRLIRGDPELSRQVRSLALEAGRAELGEDTTGVETSEIEVDLWSAKGKDAAQLQRRLNQTLRTQCAGFSFEVMTFLTERIKETLSGSNAAVAVKVYGDEPGPRWIRPAVDIARVLSESGVPGKAGVRERPDEPQTGVPGLVVRSGPLG